MDYTACSSTFGAASGKRFARDFLSVVAGRERGINGRDDGVGEVASMREKLWAERKAKGSA